MSHETIAEHARAFGLPQKALDHRARFAHPTRRAKGGGPVESPKW